MRSGLVVCAIFGAGWASIALLLSGFARGSIAFPVAISIALVAAGWRLSGKVPSRGAHVRKLIGLWSAIEAVAIVISADVLGRLHRADLLFPSAAMIVGLHFLPLARGIPVRLYYGTAAGFIVAALVGLLVPAVERPLVVGMSAALVLWTTGFMAILRVLQNQMRAPSLA